MDALTLLTFSSCSSIDKHISSNSTPMQETFPVKEQTPPQNFCCIFPELNTDLNLGKTFLPSSHPKNVETPLNNVKLETSSSPVKVSGKFVSLLNQEFALLEERLSRNQSRRALDATERTTDIEQATSPKSALLIQESKFTFENMQTEEKAKNRKILSQQTMKTTVALRQKDLFSSNDGPSPTRPNLIKTEETTGKGNFPSVHSNSIFFPSTGSYKTHDYFRKKDTGIESEASYTDMSFFSRSADRQFPPSSAALNHPSPDILPPQLPRSDLSNKKETTSSSSHVISYPVSQNNILNNNHSSLPKYSSSTEDGLPSLLRVGPFCAVDRPPHQPQIVAVSVTSQPISRSFTPPFMQVTELTDQSHPPPKNNNKSLITTANLSKSLPSKISVSSLKQPINVSPSLCRQGSSLAFTQEVDNMSVASFSSSRKGANCSSASLSSSLHIQQHQPVRGLSAFTSNAPPTSQTSQSIRNLNAAFTAPSAPRMHSLCEPKPQPRPQSNGQLSNEPPPADCLKRNNSLFHPLKNGPTPNQDVAKVVKLSSSASSLSLEQVNQQQPSHQVQNVQQPSSSVNAVAQLVNRVNSLMRRHDSTTSLLALSSSVTLPGANKDERIKNRFNMNTTRTSELNQSSAVVVRRDHKDKSDFLPSPQSKLENSRVQNPRAYDSIEKCFQRDEPPSPDSTESARPLSSSSSESSSSSSMGRALAVEEDEFDFESHDERNNVFVN
eukprot:GDKK01072465.1.p1 GENE.GDKK01072465.1~~GDKK01072465.1.p1  ORF type:complete len:789 (+),score=208.00 GDKK01072465.1:198-2369(+)